MLVTEVLDEANRALTEADAAARKMTTGAAYNIWPAQADFQMDLMARVLDEAATPGIERVRRAALSALARQLPWQEVLAEAIEVDFSESFDEPAMFLMIGVAALAAPADVTAGERRANERYVAATVELLSAIVEYSGRRLRAGTHDRGPRLGDRGARGRAPAAHAEGARGPAAPGRARLQRPGRGSGRGGRGVHRAHASIAGAGRLMLSATQVAVLLRQQGANALQANGSLTAGNRRHSLAIGGESGA